MGNAETPCLKIPPTGTSLKRAVPWRLTIGQARKCACRHCGPPHTPPTLLLFILSLNSAHQRTTTTGADRRPARRRGRRPGRGHRPAGRRADRPANRSRLDRRRCAGAPGQRRRAPRTNPAGYAAKTLLNGRGLTHRPKPRPRPPNNNGHSPAAKPTAEELAAVAHRAAAEAEARSLILSLPIEQRRELHQQAMERAPNEFMQRQWARFEPADAEALAGATDLLLMMHRILEELTTPAAVPEERRS